MLSNHGLANRFLYLLLMKMFLFLIMKFCCITLQEVGCMLQFYWYLQQLYTSLHPHKAPTFSKNGLLIGLQEKLATDLKAKGLQLSTVHNQPTQLSSLPQHQPFNHQVVLETIDNQLICTTTTNLSPIWTSIQANTKIIIREPSETHPHVKSNIPNFEAISIG